MKRLVFVLGLILVFVSGVFMGTAPPSRGADLATEGLTPTPVTTREPTKQFSVGTVVPLAGEPDPQGLRGTLAETPTPTAGEPQSPRIVVTSPGLVLDEEAELSPLDYGDIYVYTNKGCGGDFQVGEDIRIYIETRRSGYISLYDHLPNGQTQVLVQNYFVEANRRYYLDGTVGGPVGVDILRVVMAGESTQDYCSFNIGGGGPSPSVMCGYLSRCGPDPCRIPLFIECNTGREFLVPDAPRPATSQSADDLTCIPWPAVIRDPQVRFDDDCQINEIIGWSNFEYIPFGEDPFDCSQCATASAGQIYIWTNRGCGAVFQVGDPLTIYVQASQSGYASIYDHATDGNTYVLRSNVWMEANTTYRLREDFRVELPTGLELLRIVMPDALAQDYCAFLIEGESPTPTWTPTRTPTRTRTPTPTRTPTRTPTPTPTTTPLCRPGATYSFDDEIGSLAGFVKDGDTKALLSGVRVRISGPVARTAWTDSQGIYAFDGIPAGDYELEASRSEYSTYTQSVYVYPACMFSNVTLCTTDKWHGEYFANRDLQGPSSLVRCDAEIDFYWGSGSPDSRISNDNFSVRWTQDVDFNRGWYRFRTFTDDGLRLYVDGVEVINDWTARAFAEESGVIEVIREGTYQVKMEYVEWVRDAMAHLSYYQCPNGWGDCDMDIEPMYQTRHQDLMVDGCPTHTIKRYGCLITSYAMALRKLGEDQRIPGLATDPADLNEWLKNNDGYMEKDANGECDANLRGGKIDEFVRARTNGRFGLHPEDVRNVNGARDEIRSERPVIMHDNGHFFLAVDVASKNGDDTLGINDPVHDWNYGHRGTLDHRTTLKDGGYSDAKFRHSVSLTTQAASASLQFNVRGTEVLLTDAQGRRAGYDAMTGRVVREIPNSLYYDSKIVPPGEQSDGIIERVLFLPENAGGDYRLQVINVDAAAFVPTVSNFEIIVFGLDSQFNPTEATISGAIQAGATSEYQIEFDPGRELRVTPGGGKTYLPLVMRNAGTEGQLTGQIIFSSSRRGTPLDIYIMNEE